jgi:glycosyltransferase involved in cell wall biosynthesis
VICTVHNVNEGARWREVAYRVTDPLATMTTAVSEAAARRYVQVGATPAGRIRAFPNGFDFSRPADPTARQRIRDELAAGDAFLWVTAGRLDVQKGYDLLLDAFTTIRQAHPRARLAIAGDGPERGALGEQLTRLDIAGSAALLGDRSDVPALLAAADGFVLSSRWEGLPMVLLEAAAASLPIVCTDVGGNREVVRPELGGVLVDVNPRAIGDGMLRAMAMSADEREDTGRALAAHVRSEYDMAVIVGRWARVYETLATATERPR